MKLNPSAPGPLFFRRAALAASFVLLWSVPAGATFHVAHIERLMTGLDGSTDVQYVEILMELAGQGLVGGSKLIAFAADGSFDHVVLTIPAQATVTSGSNRPWIMASTGFAAAAGITPDFTFDSSDGKGLIPENGMVCWGKPDDATDPDDADMVDCVSYGNYTGPANSHTSAPSATTPFGHGLVRVSSTHSSAADFDCEDPAVPHNNDKEAGSIDASSSCSAPVCGNTVTEDPEECDDGDEVFAQGDACSSTCTAVLCGSPTKEDGTSPKASDALFVLKAAVSSSHCDLEVCDVNKSKTVTASDALAILKKAVGQNVILDCP